MNNSVSVSIGINIRKKIKKIIIYKIVNYRHATQLQSRLMFLIFALNVETEVDSFIAFGNVFHNIAPLK